MKQIRQRWVHVIWCDDVRHEMGNKPSFMGVYSADLVVQSLPTTLLRLAAHVQVGAQKDRPLKTVRVRIKRNDAEESVAEVEMPPEALAAMNAQVSAQAEAYTANDDDKSATILVGFLVILGPLTLNESTKWLKVFVDTEEETLESFKLRIRSDPAPQAAVLH